MGFSKEKGFGTGTGGGSLPPVIINVPADYPTNAEADKNTGQHYIIGSTSVTDNDPTKTNTGLTFFEGQDIMWNITPSTYFKLGDDTIWIRDPAGALIPLTSTDDIGTTLARIKKIWATDVDSANFPTLNQIKLHDADPTSGTVLLSGGELSVNAGDPTKFDIEAGGAKIVDSFTDPENPVVVNITWVKQIAVTVTDIGTQFVTFVGVNSSGTFVQNGAGFSPSDERDIATLGILSHVNLTTIDTTSNFGNWGRDIKLDISDLMSGLGGRINLGGNEYNAGGATLNISKTEGFTYGMGVNYAIDKKNPNIRTNPVQGTPIPFVAVYLPFNIAFTIAIPNDKYDPNGDGALVDIPDGYFTTHRIFFDSNTGQTVLQYGQYVYDSLKKAATSWEQESFQRASLLENLSLRTILIIQEGCEALNDPDCAKFVQIGTFGDRTFNTVESFSRFAEPVEIIDGMSYRRQALSYVDDGGVLYADIAAEFNFEASDISFINADSSINTVVEDFTTANLQVGDRVIVTGSANNNGIFTVATIAATKITVSETITDESAGADIKIETPGKGDITFVFGQREFILDCVTGSGVGGRARIALTAGTDTTPSENWVSVIRSGETATLQSSVTEPSGEYSMICTAFVPSVATSTSDGFYNSRRHTDTKEIDGRGAIATILSKLRNPSSYVSGAAGNITIDTVPTPDSVDYTVAEGVFREVYKQNTNALRLSVDGALVINDSVTDYKTITDLNEITHDANGNPLNNKYFQLIMMVSLNADGHFDKLLINLPTGSYLSATAAFEDTSSFSVTTAPAGFKSVYLLFAGVLRIQGTNTITNEALAFGVNNIDLRGQDLGSRSSGSGTAAITNFSDSLFSIFSNADSTKQIVFNAAEITPGNAREIIMPDRDVHLGDEFLFVRTGTTGIKFTTEGDNLALITHSTNDLAVENAVANAVSSPLSLIHSLSSGSPAVGIGTSLPFHVQSGSGSANKAGTIDVILSNVSSGNEESYIDFFVQKSGSLINAFNISPPGISTRQVVQLAADSSLDGPHHSVFTDSDAYPLFQQLNWAHDNINITFDAEFTAGGWKSSYSGSNLQLIKNSNEFMISYDSGVAAGNTVTWNNGFAMDLTNGHIGLGGAPHATYQLYVQNGFNIGCQTIYGASDLTLFTGDGTDKILLDNSSSQAVISAAGGLFSGTVYDSAVSGRDVQVNIDGRIGYLSSILASKIQVQELNNCDFLYDLNVKSFYKRKKLSDIKVLKNNSEEAEDDAYTDEYYPDLHYGLIAEEAKLVSEDLVFYGDDGELAGVYYQKLISPAIKSLQIHNDRLKKIEVALGI